MAARTLLLVLLAACAAPAPWRPPEPPAAPALADSVWACDQRAGREVTLAEMLDSLARHDAVFLGETHLDETTHALELAVYEGLVERRGQVVLALEMFERDVQPVLDDYLAGRIPEEEFLAKARPWANYRTGYRPLVEAARRHGLPVVASNAPVALRRQVGMGGPAALDALPPEERALLPDVLHPNPAAYWERVARATRGHMMAAPAPDQLLTSGQSLWDNTMGDSCARALDGHPGSLVLHVNGSFHSQFREGAVHQLLVRRPATRVAVLEAVPAHELRAFDPFGAADRADFLVFVRRRASGPSGGFHSVTVAPELRFRLRLPAGASDARPAPLLLWLGDDGFRAEDGLALWAAALGDEAAIAVVEPPYPFLDDDLVQGGRWTWPETFDKDLGMLGAGLGRILEYVARHYPVDRARLVVAGEGTGATVVAATALYERTLARAAIAVAPRRFQGLRSLGLPGPAERGSLRVLALEADAPWWTQEAADHGKAGLGTAVAAAPESAWERFGLAQDEVRKALRLASRPLVAGEETVLRLDPDTPRARAWARRYALRLGGPVRIAAEGGGVRLGFGAGGRFRPEDLADGRCLPLAAGPFGGTTILVVPAEATAEERAAWQALAEQDAIKKRSRFARLVVVPADEEGALARALDAIVKAGRRAVLVAPAAFCADAETMRGLAAEARPFEDALDLAWLPGLGGELHRLAGPADAH